MRYLIVIGYLLVLSGLARALPPTVAEQPAATLMLPYFEVDIGGGRTRNTLFTVNNAAATPALANVTLWTDLGIPVYSFRLYLTGYDMQTVDLRQVLLGSVPQTGGSLSPTGPLSPTVVSFANCSAPVSANPLPTALPFIQTALTGKAWAGGDGKCRGAPYGATNTIARGYVTVDSVRDCSVGYPGDTGYFASGGTGKATNDNVLWGDYQYFRSGIADLATQPLVHLRADDQDPKLSTAGSYTFYGRLVGWTAADNREPTSTKFGARYYNTKKSTPSLDSTTLIVWRDPKLPVSAFTCGTTPAGYPLTTTDLVALDEQERVFDLDSPQPAPIFPQPPPPPPALPWATQAVSLPSAALPVPFTSGWIALNLNHAVTSPPITDPTTAQAWVTSQHRGMYGVSFSLVGATPFDTAKEACSANYFSC